MRSYIFFLLTIITFSAMGQDVLFCGTQTNNSFFSFDPNSHIINTLATGQSLIRRIRVDQNLEQVFWSSGGLNKIQKVDANLAGSNRVDVKTNITNVSTINIDAENNKVYYFLPGGFSIFQCDTNGNNNSTLISLPTSSPVLGIEIDSESNFIYWYQLTPGTRRIRRADLLTGINQITIFSSPDFLFDIKLIKEDSSILFSNRNGNRVQKINTDGTGLTTIVNEPSGPTVGTIAGDFCNNSIYYYLNNAGAGLQIKKTDFQGSTPVIVLDTSFSSLSGIDALYQYNIGRRKDFLGPDATTCQDSVIMTALVRGATYLWNDNSTNASLITKQSGIFSVTVTAGNCTKVDSIQITVNSNFQVNLGNDTTINISDSLTISSNIPNATYRWNDGSTADSLIVKTNGTYWVDVTLNGCTKRDFIVINFVPRSTLISGVINKYAKVNSIQTSSCQDTIFVTDTSGFSTVEGLLIIQMQGASTNNSNTSIFGDVTNLNNAGNYEFAIIESVGNNYVLVADVLLKSYTVSSSVQIVTVPKFKNITIQNNLTALKWDGNKGGVLALNVTDTITLNGSIDVDSCGFREGKTYSGPLYPLNGSGCSRTDYFAAFGNFNGGEKGEGIAINPSTRNYGRGHNSNGGGGGNSHNSGGAGGGNAGAGGTGGNEFSNCSSPSSIGGIGGQVISTSILVEKAFLGGGGGAGDANFSAGTSGGSGGGLIFLKSDIIVANNNLISAQGEEASTSTSDGAGGGGAGGTILLDVRGVIGSLTVNSNAGKGGNMNNSGSCVGPGGGGGGGLINYSNSGILPNSLLTASGAQNGISTNPVAPCFNSNYGATAGTNGVVLSNLTSLFNITTSRLITTILGNDTSICFGDSIVLSSFVTGAAYSWSDNSTNSTLKVKQSGIYSVTVTVGSCAKVDSITITVNPDFTIDIGVDSTLCFGDSIILDATTPTASYLWSDNSSAATLKVKQVGIYWVDVTVNGCAKRDSVTINIDPDIQPTLGNDTSICFGDSVQFNLNFPGFLYLWSDASTDSAFTIKESGVFWAEITSIFGCKSRDSIQVSVNSSSLINLGNDTTLCFGDSLILNVTNAATSIKWSDNSTNSTLTITSAGIYFVDVDLLNCSFRDSIVISFTNNVGNNFLGTDTSLCDGDSINFNFGLIPSQTFLWSDSSTLPTNTFKQSGPYWLEISENSCASRDSFNLIIKEKPQINLGPDTSICKGELFGSSSSNPNTSYLWNTGANDSTIAITTNGIYWLEVFLNGCITRDSINLTTNPKPSVNIGTDTTLCLNDTLRLFKPSFNSSFLWNDSSTMPSFEVTEPGLYWLDVTFEGCSNRDSVMVEYFDTLGTYFLPETVSICPPEQKEVTLPLFNSTYLWQDGSSARNYSLQKSGVYFVEISNTCGTRTDTLIAEENCPCSPIFPTIFTPNNDNINDFLEFNLNCDIDQFSAIFFSRWGEKVFESSQPNFLWDGIVKGKKAKVGTYYYVVKWKPVGGSLETRKGSLLLTR